MKRFFWILMTAVLLLGLLCGCSENENIYGTWIHISADPEADVRQTLESMDFYEEEIALIDLNSMYTAMLLEFHEDGTYVMGVDEEATAELTKTFAEGMIDALYAGRESLASLYGAEVAAMSLEDFRQLYAELFGCADYAAFLDMFAYELWEFTPETGTYNAAMGNIYMTAEGQTEAEYVPYEIKSGKLIVSYSDGALEYTKEE